jgi:hypothetical protein
MRIRNAIFLGSMAALAALMAPAPAKNSDAPKSTEKSTSPSCNAYQQAADGSWTQLPCQELGSGAQPRRKSATRSPNEETR